MGSPGVAIRRLRAADAVSLVACFRRCYGGTYVAEVFRDPVGLAARVAEGALRSVVAVAPGGAVVGHMGITLHAPGALTAEAGNTVVDPRYRGQHLATRLGAELGRLCLASGLVGFHHYPTTAHPVMQKLAVQGGGVECGVLLDYIPAETRYLGFERSGVGRLAVVSVYQPLAAAPARRVRLPARHRDTVLRLYARAGLERRSSGSGAPLPAADARLAVWHEASRGLLRIRVESAGADLAPRVAAAAARQPHAGVLVDLPLAEPAGPAAAEALTGAGFFFGALLPEYLPSGDALRLQRPAAEPRAPQLATPGAEALLAYGLEDRRSGPIEEVEIGPGEEPPAPVG